GEIYNLHMTVVDKNPEGNSKRTCQKDAKDLAELFAKAIDSGKTGEIIDRKPLNDIRNNHSIGWKQPDFLRRGNGKPEYESPTLLGKLYREGLRTFLEAQTSSTSSDSQRTLMNTKKSFDSGYSAQNSSDLTSIINNFPTTTSLSPNSTENSP
ncbi:unnamed protein product, partial [Didymodactylos carnosus]